MNNDDIITTTHIDQLRAGLLDQDSVLKSRVRSALNRDNGLSEQNELWTEVCEQLESSGNDDPRLTNQLRIRRRSVLSGRASSGKPRRFTWPQMAIATAASMALTLSIVLWFGERPNPDTLSITQVNSAAPTGSNSPDLAIGTAVDIDMDLTNNVDFYVWLESQDDVYIEMPRKGS